MLPQHGGVPNFSMRIPGPILALLALVLVTGLLLTLLFYFNADPGDQAARNRTCLALMGTLLLATLLLLGGTHRWWYRHLWNRGNSQRSHRHRRRHETSSSSRRTR
jgi:hypothetical protein